MKIICESPSNIALIKYWGKHGNQLPNNPSLSFTLTNSKTITSIEYTQGSGKISFFFEGKQNADFENRIKRFLQANIEILPFIKDYDFIINSKNTFPHSAGIASSASAFSALSAAFRKIKSELGYNIENFEQEISYLSRLGSGSACRSVYPGVVLWGKTDLIKESSNEYAIPVNQHINKEFLEFNDDILIVEKSKKQVSSSAGHSLMDTNPYRKEKYNQANINLSNILKAMQENNIDDFIDIVEHEALALHSMMMLSKPSFILMSPKTLDIIKKLCEYRNETKIPLCFTLDAGPNVHLLYHKKYTEKANEFLSSISSIEIIKDKVGQGTKFI